MTTVHSAVRALRDVLVGGIQLVLALVSAPLLRGRYNRWGATPAEVGAPLPGDGLVAAPDLGYTRAVTVAAAPERVWPWLAQIGQGRGGFYSFDGLENLIGCHIHSADVVLPDEQDLRAGDLIRLAPAEQAPVFRVEDVRPPTTLVLVSAGPPSAADAARDGDTVATWQWALRPTDGGRRTRLIVRQRLTYPRSQRVLWGLLEPVTFVMERRMLCGLRRRAESAPSGQQLSRAPG